MSNDALSDQSIQSHLDQLTKPPGSLGLLEDLACSLCRIQETLVPETRPREIVLFAGDHGVVARGVSSWPSEITGLMVENIATGGAASNALAISSETKLRLVDVGCVGPSRKTEGSFRNARVANGTRDLSIEPAMDRAQWDQAFAIGQEEAQIALARGARVLAAGEMGIGNTTPSTCLAAVLCNLDVVADGLVGTGAGGGEEMLAAKRTLIAKTVARARAGYDFAGGGDRDARIQALASIAGFEIASMAGFYMAAAEGGAVIVIDGLISTAGALIAEDLFPGVAKNMIAAHASVEPSHQQMLAKLGLAPYLDWNLRLGEGTGALLLMPMLDAAASMVTNMASFADLGITQD